MGKGRTILIVLASMALGALIAVTAFRKAVVNEGYVGRNLSGSAEWSKLNLILRCIDGNYVDTVDYEALSEAAIDAVLAALDPHSVYMEPQILKDSEDDLAGEFEGIGIQFNVPNDTAIVLEVISGGPSEKIGLKTGDRLLKVDDKVIAGVKFPQDSMVRRMKGPAGTKVTVTVGRGAEEIPFEITRGKIPTHSIDAYFMADDTTGYVRLSKFARTTYSEVSLAALDLMAKGMTKMVLDLRDNTGGFFDQALLLSNLFLPKDAPVVYMEGRNREREDYNADGTGFLQNIALDVLINEGSASSSEIVAGAIQDNARGRIIGRRSFGKGLVQEPMYFSDGSGIRLTVARFYTPSGRCLQKPYDENYDYEVYLRYNTGEMYSADSMKVEKGGIIPDVFVPVDTTRASKFYQACNRKATSMRFASAYFDSHKDELSAIGDYDALTKYLDKAGLERKFLDFARTRDGLVPDSEWAEERRYMLTQVRALVGRYSALGDKAYYHIFLDIDDTFKRAVQR